MRRETHWLGVLEPEEFQRFHGHGTWTGVGVGFVMLALMAHYEASIRWMTATAFIFGMLALSELVKDAAIWIEARLEAKARAPSPDYPDHTPWAVPSSREVDFVVSGARR